jgi:invasion protein IalB
MKYGTLLLALGLIFSNGLVMAQDDNAKAAADAPKPTTYKNWDVLCEKDPKGVEHCQMFQNIGLNISKEVTLRMQVKLGYVPGQTDPVLLLTLKKLPSRWPP